MTDDRQTEERADLIAARLMYRLSTVAALRPSTNGQDSKICIVIGSQTRRSTIR